MNTASHTVFWKPAYGYDGRYLISEWGGVYSVSREMMRSNGRILPIKGGLLTHTIDKKGYPRVCLSKDGKTGTRLVHHLVLEAFVGPRPEGMEALHNDGNPANCSLENLRWDTHSANMKDRVRHGRDPMANRTHCKNGHLFTESNLYVFPSMPNSGRLCGSCWRAKSRKSMAKHRAKMKAMTS